jgi:hypothetical protein
MEGPQLREPAPAYYSERPASTCSETPDGVLASQPETGTAINELQDAFGAILLTDKKSQPVADYCRWDLRSWRITSHVPPPILPKWTDNFDLVSFPREIRDTIYYHYLYRYRGIQYQHCASHPILQNLDRSDNILPLFLTCRQVYDEALQVFCRYNQIEIPVQTNRRHRDYGRAPTGILRLFPDKARGLVQRIRSQYSQDYVCTNPHDGTAIYQQAGEVFVQILRDAHTFKTTFPMLREFTASWSVYGSFKHEVLLDLDENSEERSIRLWLGWMRHWVGRSNVVPPSGVNFQYGQGWQQCDLQKHAKSMNEAYSRLLKETSAAEKGVVNLEESGKKWIEEMAKVKRKKKRSSG